MKFFKRRIGRKIPISLWVAFVIIFLYSLTLITPLYFMLTNSFKNILDYLYNNPWGVPKKMYFENYASATTLTVGKVSFLGMYINSFVFTCGAVLISTATATMTAYALAKFKFWGRDFLVALGIGAIVIPDLGSSSVIYKMYVDLNFIDTWAILLRYTGPYGMQFLVLYAFFKGLSGGYIEAAKIDGASELTVFLRICIPMAQGALGATMVILFINNWNDYLTPYMYLPSLKTLSIGLQELSATVSQLDRPKLYAAMIIAITPLLIIFIIMRDKIIANTVSGGLKG